MPVLGDKLSHYEAIAAIRRTLGRIDWSEWEEGEHSIEEASNRLMVLRKTVEGRAKKCWREVVEALKRRVLGVV